MAEKKTPQNRKTGARQLAEQKRRNKILRTAEKHFLKKGFAATSTRAIANDAGISLGNLYNHFKNKEAIFEALIEEHSLADEFEEIISLMREDENFPDGFPEILTRIKEIVARNKVFIRLADIDSIEFGGRKTRDVIISDLGKVWGPLAEVYEKYRSKGLVRPFHPQYGLPVIGLAIFATFVALNRFQNPFAQDNPEVDDSDVINELASFFLHGLIGR